MELSTKTTYRNFFFLWVGQQISLLGSNIAQFVIIWWIAFTYKNSLYLGLASFLGFGSNIITALIGGVYVDRYNRKKIILLSDTCQTLITSWLIILFLTGAATINIIFVILTLRGIFQGFQQPAIWAIVPVMVPADKLTKINSFDYLAQGLASLFGPVIGAGLLALIGLDMIGYILLIDIISYAISLFP